MSHNLPFLIKLCDDPSPRVRAKVFAQLQEIPDLEAALLAGGLTPDNVGAGIRQVRPFGVDVASGIEDRPEIKNARAMQAFVAAVREADK